MKSALPPCYFRQAQRGATVNIVFMDHFQRVAHAHFTLRRLERIYGSSHIKQRYAEFSAP